MKRETSRGVREDKAGNVITCESNGKGEEEGRERRWEPNGAQGSNSQ